MNNNIKIIQISDGWDYNNYEGNESWLCIAKVLGTAGNMEKYVLGRISNDGFDQYEGFEWVGKDAYERAMDAVGNNIFPLSKEEIKYLRSFDWSEIMKSKNRFYANGDYSPFVLEGFNPDYTGAQAVLQLIDPDLYVCGGSNGLEVSRKSFWY